MSVRKTAISQNGIETYTLIDNGLELEVINYGARLHKLFLNDKNGNKIDILAGFDAPDDYMGDNPYFNAIIGRVANRIEKSAFKLNEESYKLFSNEGENCLHGGKKGFDRRMFNCEILDEESNSLVMTYVSPDGEENFPGTLTLKVIYILENSSLRIIYDATTNKDTPFNPTNHAYFNLNGSFDSVLNHEVFIDSEEMTVADRNLICHGEIMKIKHTPFDFSVTKTIGKDIKNSHPLLVNARGGYDFNYILRKNRNIDSPVATAYSGKSGIKMSVYTDCPCLQFYTGNFLDGTIKGKVAFPYQSTFCMETQSYPNACNVPSFPSIILKKDERFHSETKYVFSIQ